MPIQAPNLSVGEEEILQLNESKNLADFAAQYPDLLGLAEIIGMREEVTAWQAISEDETGLKVTTWRELNSLAFTSGSCYISFANDE